MLKFACLAVAVCLAAGPLLTPARAAQLDGPPISQHGLLRALRNKRPHHIIFQQLEKRGVTFELTSAIEAELRRQAGAYLPAAGVEQLLELVRGNFRGPAKRYEEVYYLFGGHGIDLLLQAEIGNRLGGRPGGNFYISKNEVYTTLAALVRRFSYRFNGANVYLTEGGEQELSGKLNKVGASLARVERRLKAANGPEDVKMRMFVGSIGDLNPDDAPEPELTTAGDPQLTASFIESLKDPGQPWRMFWQSGMEGKWKWGDVAFVFRKFATRADLEKFPGSSLQDFYLHLTREHFPRGFGFVSLFGAMSQECGDGEGSATTEARFSGPFLSLLITVIENTADAPIQVNDYVLKKNPATRLRTLAEDQDLLKGQPPQVGTFPRRLLPGDKLIIPVRLTLSHKQPGDGDARRFLTGPLPEALPYTEDASRALREAGGVEFSVPRVRVPAATLEQILSRPEENQLPDEYVYGPSINIDDITVDGYTYVVRQFDPKQVFISSSGWNVGSCPYVYTYSAASGTWLNEGVVLYGVNEKRKETVDEKPLSRFDGRVLVKEVDPEDSYLDSMRVRARAADGTETILFPRDRRLVAADGNYLKLSRGEQVVITFDVPPGFNAQRYTLVTSGYYLPYPAGSGRPGVAPRELKLH